MEITRVVIAGSTYDYVSPVTIRIDFNLIVGPPERKTAIYDVIAKDGGHLLGQVRWFGRWRCYAFYPSPDCVFERTCLQDIIAFIIELMTKRKATARGKRKEG